MITLLEKNVKNIILVSSGKGGVGKSTVSANLAGALKLDGNKVGILDADIHGPSQHHMFGISYESATASQLVPIESNGILVLSAAAFRDENTATVWRGPMVTAVINSMFFNTAWPELDYLVVDMPPGTGDIQIEICKKLPSASAVIVTTPQEVALLDCQKGVSMFQNAGIKILGVVENMNAYRCPSCGDVSYIFGEAKTKKMLEKYSLDLIGQLPIDPTISGSGDKGIPSVFSDNLASKEFRSIGSKIVELCKLSSSDEMITDI